MNLEHERKKMELKRVELARDEMQFKILQRKADIDRLANDIKVQNNRINELKEALLLRQTEINDKQAIKKSDVIIFYLDDRIGFGTKTEFSWCYEWKKPMIIIRNVPRKDLSHWIKWRRYYALVIERFALEFKSLTDFQNYMLELKKEVK